MRSPCSVAFIAIDWLLRCIYPDPDPKSSDSLQTEEDSSVAALEVALTQTVGQEEGNFTSLQTEEGSSVASFEEVQIQTEDLSPPQINDLWRQKDDVLIKVSETVTIREHNKQEEQTSKQANENTVE